MMAGKDNTLHKNIGVAVDVGSTTIGVCCLDLARGIEISSFSFPNPQVKYGADVITRIKHCIDDEKMVHTLSGVLRQELTQQLKSHLQSDYLNISEICYSGNTTMLHLLRGLSVAGLSKAPFSPVTLDYYEEMASLNSLEQAACLSGEKAVKQSTVLNPANAMDIELELYLPGFSAFVGADILSGAEYLKLGRGDAYDLLIDLGTNGELLLLNDERGFATSTACGPVFDYGVTGAKYGSESIHAIASCVKRGLIDATGLIKEPFFEKGIALDHGFVIRQEQVRRFQMAKAAIFAGIICLMRKAEIGFTDIGQVFISGGLGFYLDVRDAFITKLLPKEFKGRIVISGNTSLFGAKRYILARHENIRYTDDASKVYFAQVSDTTETCSAHSVDTTKVHPAHADDSICHIHADEASSTGKTTMQEDISDRSSILQEYDAIRSRTETFELAEYQEFNEIYIDSMNF